MTNGGTENETMFAQNCHFGVIFISVPEPPFIGWSRSHSEEAAPAPPVEKCKMCHLLNHILNLVKYFMFYICNGTVPVPISTVRTI